MRSELFVKSTFQLRLQDGLKMRLDARFLWRLLQAAHTFMSVQTQMVEFVDFVRNIFCKGAKQLMLVVSRHYLHLSVHYHMMTDFLLERCIEDILSSQSVSQYFPFSVHMYYPSLKNHCRRLIQHLTMLMKLQPVRCPCSP